MRKIRRCQRAFTVVDLLMIIAVIAVTAALVAAAGFGLSKARKRAYRLPCINNVKQCELAFMVWSSDNNDKFPMEVSTNLGGTRELISEGNVFRHFQVMSNELSTPKIVTCPAADGRRSATNFTTDFNDQKVSFFVDLDASTTNSEAWLCGDRNITNGLPLDHGVMTLATRQSAGWTREVHDRCGNVAIGGSVQQISNRGLQEMLNGPARWTNRITLPE